MISVCSYFIIKKKVIFFFISLCIQTNKTKLKPIRNAKQRDKERRNNKKKVKTLYVENDVF